MSAHADSIEVQSAEIELIGSRYFLHADFGFDLSARLEDAVNNGLPLNFLIEFELTRRRWYWFNEKIAAEKIALRLSYSPLVQQYRLTNGTLTENFTSLADALRVLRRVRSWPVVERGLVDNGVRYEASVRMRLDTSQLPKPVQVSALTDREWTQASSWWRFAFTPLAPVSEAK